MNSRVSREERKKRVREAIIIVLAVILIVFLTKAEISLTQLSADAKLGSNIAIFAVINIAVACHLIPTTGVALPFISYGGTALLLNSLGVGILISISRYKKRAIEKSVQPFASERSMV